MFTNWNDLSTNQRTLFLQATGLDKLPEPGVMDVRHQAVLAVILAGDAVPTALRDVPGSIAKPALDAPVEKADWTKILAMVAEIAMKLTEMKTLSADDIRSLSDGVRDAKAANVQRVMKPFIEASDKPGRFVPPIHIDIDFEKIRKNLSQFAILAGLVSGLVFTAAALIGEKFAPDKQGESQFFWTLAAAGFALAGIGGAAYDPKKTMEFFNSIAEAAQQAARFVGDFLQDEGSRQIMSKLLQSLLDGLVESGDLSVEDAAKMLTFFLKGSLFIGKILSWIGGDSRDRSVNPEAGDPELAKAIAAGRDDGELRALLARESMIMDGFVDGLNRSVAGLADRLKDMAQPQQNIMASRGM